MQANTPESGRIAATQRTEGSGPLLLMVPWQNERAKLQWRRLQALTCAPQRFHTTDSDMVTVQSFDTSCRVLLFGNESPRVAHLSLILYRDNPLLEVRKEYPSRIREA